jgi:hypothetical protein
MQEKYCIGVLGVLRSVHMGRDSYVLNRHGAWDGLFVRSRYGAVFFNAELYFIDKEVTGDGGLPPRGFYYRVASL